jgi:CTP:molybdopterin cytidylyltransferase MocA
LPASARSGSAPLAALVLAGRRGGSDPIASQAGVSHKALAPLCGAPMLLHVLRTLWATPGVTRLVVSIDEPALLPGIDELAAAAADGRLLLHRSRESPSASVLDAIERLAPDAPLLVTTADHPLLTREMVEHFLAAAGASCADVVVAVVSEQTLRARLRSRGAPGSAARRARDGREPVPAAHARRAARGRLLAARRELPASVPGGW